MNQFFMSNRIIRNTIDILFPPVIRNELLQLFRSFLDQICLIQLYIYFAVDAVPFLRWLCPAFEMSDLFMRGFCWIIVYAIKIEVWFLLNMARLYGKLLRYVIYLFFGYSILVSLANMDFSANIPLLETILQNTEWIYAYAGQFIDFNVAIVKKAVENFYSMPFEQKSLLERTIINGVKPWVEMVNTLINN